MNALNLQQLEMQKTFTMSATTTETFPSSEAIKELSILLLKLYNDGAIGISDISLDLASVIKTDNQLLIRSVRFMQVDPPLVRSCHPSVD
jgi:predicted glycosyltransferase